MPVVFPQSALDFLSELTEHNSKEWMDANRKRYAKELKAPAQAFARSVNGLLEEISPGHASADPRKNLSRINRDIRFSKDKTPYNTHVWAGWGPGGGSKGGGAGFYVGVSPTSYGIGAGVWRPEKEQLAALRQRIAEDHATLRAIVEEPEFAAAYGVLQGESYKRVPKPWPQDHPAAEWLKLKGVHVRHEGDPARIPAEDFLSVIDHQFRVLEPLVSWLNDAMGIDI